MAKFPKRYMADGTATTIAITQVIERKPGSWEVMYSGAGQPHLNFPYGWITRSGDSLYFRPCENMREHHTYESAQFKAGLTRRMNKLKG